MISLLRRELGARRAVPVLALGLLLGPLLASGAQGSPRLYSASLIIDTFGNDVTTGSFHPFSTDIVIGIPLLGHCDTVPYHAQETLTFPTYPNATQVIMLTIPNYGGGVPDLDTNGDGVPDIIDGCGSASRRAGNPLTGSGTLLTTGDPASSRTSMNPRGISIPPSAISRVTSASFPGYGVYLFEVHYADLANQAGAFSKGGGDGSFSVVHSAAEGTRKAVQSAGKNRYGGVMRLLGSYRSVTGYLYAGLSTSIGHTTWLFDYLGAGGQAKNGNGTVTAGYQVSAENQFTSIPSGVQNVGKLYNEVFKWTTGTVKVTAVQGTFPTFLERKGHDSRTAMGAGEVQLVTPMLSHWVSIGDSSSAAIGVMKVNFVPEPTSLATLGAGVVTLGLLVHIRRSAKRQAHRARTEISAGSIHRRRTTR